MSIRATINPSVERELWARSAGRCQFPTCNKILYETHDSLENVNSGQKAHIIPISEKAARGNDLSSCDKDNINKISNLMLLCYECHRRVDRCGADEKYTVDQLLHWKKAHEDRIRTLTGIKASMKSHVVVYSSRINDDLPSMDTENILQALPARGRYPTDSLIKLNSNQTVLQDGSLDFWQMEERHLVNLFQQRIVPIIEDVGQSHHFSLFSIATMPLLIRLGTLFTDKIDVNVHQKLRNPSGWLWQDCPENFKYIVKEPDIKKNSDPALVISISGLINRGDVSKVVGTDAQIWELTVPEEHVNTDTIRHYSQLNEMRKVVSNLMERLNNIYGNKPLSIFPAMPVSCAIELGRVRMPKLGMPWLIYDFNRKCGGFVRAIDITQL